MIQDNTHAHWGCFLGSTYYSSHYWGNYSSSLTQIPNHKYDQNNHWSDDDATNKPQNQLSILYYQDWYFVDIFDETITRHESVFSSIICRKLCGTNRTMYSQNYPFETDYYSTYCRSYTMNTSTASKYGIEQSDISDTKVRVSKTRQLEKVLTKGNDNRSITWWAYH